jgi:hypothetical protein
MSPKLKLGTKIALTFFEMKNEGMTKVVHVRDKQDFNILFRILRVTITKK